MTFTLALMIAVSYWGARDIQTPCHPQAVAVTSAQMAIWDADGPKAYMRTDPARCTIYLGRTAAAAGDGGWRSFLFFCQGVVHEVGHVDGLAHTHDGGIMDPGPVEYIPWGCEYPKRWLKRHRHHDRIVLTSPTKPR